MDAKKLQRLVEDFELDIDAVESQLAPVFEESFEDQAEKRNGKEAVMPYALAAYSLSSLIFAYLRSEGEPTDLVQEEIERVQKLIKRIETTENSAPSKKDRKKNAKAAEAVRREQFKRKHA